MSDANNSQMISDAIALGVSADIAAKTIHAISQLSPDELAKLADKFALGDMRLPEGWNENR